MNSPRDPGAAEFFADHPWAFWLAVAGAAGGTLAFASRAVMTTSGRKRIENITLAVMTGGELLGLLGLRFGKKNRSSELAQTPRP
jgi:hypothetical protein